MDKILYYLVNKFVEIDKVIFFSNDEIVIDVSDLDISNQKIDELKIFMEGITLPLRVEFFRLHKINGVDGYYKEIYKNEKREIKFKCIDPYVLPFVMRKMLGEKITDSDRTFLHNGLLAKFIEDFDIGGKE